MKKPKITALMLVIALLFSISGASYALTPFAESGPERDVSWTKEFIGIAVAEGWLPEEYNPSDIMTYDDFFQFVCLAAGHKTIDLHNFISSRFKETLDFLIDWDEPITRETALFVLDIAFELNMNDDYPYFEDHDEISDWAKGAATNLFFCRTYHAHKHAKRDRGI